MNCEEGVCVVNQKRSNLDALSSIGLARPASEPAVRDEGVSAAWARAQVARRAGRLQPLQEPLGPVVHRARAQRPQAEAVRAL
eukprot:COSAG04_NODE_11845_length_685_cov_0.633106_2_plen_82_part_01